MLTSESLAAHPPLHAGHKGLFFDKLRGPLFASVSSSTLGAGGCSGAGVGPGQNVTGVYELDLLTPRSTMTGGSAGFIDECDGGSIGGGYAQLGAQGRWGVYQMRNRAYSPYLGRFLQRDPNATAMTLIQSAASQGEMMGAAVSTLSPDSMFGDGHNLYEYVGSNPSVRSDPLGLRFSPMDTLREGSIAVFGFDAMAAGDAGGMIGAGLQGLVRQYSANLSADVDWALDWSAGDQLHSRRSNLWVADSIMRGVLDYLGVGVNDEGDGYSDDDEASGPSMAGSSRGSGGARAGGAAKVLTTAQRAAYQQKRVEFNALRKGLWYNEVFGSRTQGKYSPSDRARVLNGTAPIRNGEAMHIHHKKRLRDGGTNDLKNLEFVTASEHRNEHRKKR